MDARTRDLERRIVAGELGLLVDLRAAYMRLRDPRRDPLPGDVQAWNEKHAPRAARRLERERARNAAEHAYQVMSRMGKRS